MSENDTMNKRELPLQSDDREFDNFFGLKFGSEEFETLFQMRAMGWKFQEYSFNYGRKVETFIFKSNYRICDCDTKCLRLTFVLKKGKRILKNITVLFDYDKQNLEKVFEKLTENLKFIVTKYSLILKHNRYFLHKPTKRSIALRGAGDDIFLIIAENKTKEYIGYSPKGTPWIFFASKYVGIDKGSIFSNPISEDLKDAQFCLFAALSIAYNYAEREEQLEFWQDKKKSAHAIALAESLVKIFDTERDSFDKNTICAEIRQCINDAKVETDKKIKEEKINKKAAKEAAETAKVKKLEDALDDL